MLCNLAFFVTLLSAVAHPLKKKSYLLAENYLSPVQDFNLHSEKRTTCLGLMKTALNNVVLPTLFNVVNNIVQHCYT